MSLSVFPYVRDADGRIQYLGDVPPEPRNMSAGSEGWRRGVWGSKELRALGLRVLPSLADDDIYAEGAELEALERELNVLRAAVATLGSKLADSESLLYRIDNIAWAVTRALECGGGVNIG